MRTYVKDLAYHPVRTHFRVDPAHPAAALARQPTNSTAQIGHFALTTHYRTTGLFRFSYHSVRKRVMVDT